MPLFARAWYSYVWGSPRLASQVSKLAGGADPVIDHSCVDVQATDLIRIVRPPVPHVFDAQHRAALLGGNVFAQLVVPAGDIEVRIVQPQRQVNPPGLAGPVHGKGHVVTLIPDLAGHAPMAPLVVVLEGRDPQLPNDPLQQPQHVLGREVTGGEHHHIEVAPAHQPGHETAREEQRADIGDQRGQVELGKHLLRLLLQRALPGQQVLIGRRRHH